MTPFSQKQSEISQLEKEIIYYVDYIYNHRVSPIDPKFLDCWSSVKWYCPDSRAKFYIEALMIQPVGKAYFNHLPEKIRNAILVHCI